MPKVTKSDEVEVSITETDRITEPYDILVAKLDYYVCIYEIVSKRVASEHVQAVIVAALIADYDIRGNVDGIEVLDLSEILSKLQ